MSSERIQGRLMRAGMDEEEVYTMGRPELLEAMARVLLGAETVAAAAKESRTDTQLQFELMRLQLVQRDRELQMQHMEYKMQVEQRDREHAREMNYARIVCIGGSCVKKVWLPRLSDMDKQSSTPLLICRLKLVNHLHGLTWLIMFG